MITLLASILGFAGPFIPELLKWLNRKEDNKHELAMMSLQLQYAEKAHAWKMEEITATADIAEMQALRQPQQSFGVQLLDAAKGWPRWAILPVFWAFAVLDWLNGSVRPVVTYWIVGFWLLYKYSLFELARARMGWESSVVANWNENDAAVLMLCLSYFFGQRAAKAAFGGSASTGRAGGG